MRKPRRGDTGSINTIAQELLMKVENLQGLCRTLGSFACTGCQVAELDLADIGRAALVLNACLDEVASKSWGYRRALDDHALNRRRSQGD